MSRHSTRILATGIALATVIALALAASGSTEVRSFALDVPNEGPVAAIPPHGRACEGPLTSTDAFDRVGIWASAARLSRATIQVLDNATSQVLAVSGTFDIGPAQTELTRRLSRRVAANHAVVVCVAAARDGVFLWGAPASVPGVNVIGVPHNYQFSLVLLRRFGSLFSALPTVFSRASLWRPHWVGRWTFWVLALALVATFGVAVAAVCSAAGADDSGAWRASDSDDHLGPGKDHRAPSRTQDTDRA